MNEVVNRVVAALDKFKANAYQHAPYSTVDIARAAIAALREPTDAQLEAGCAAHPPGDYHMGTTLIDIIKAEWIDMVDAALK
jgi:hypothetical protein